jgi:hypothetical protein
LFTACSRAPLRVFAYAKAAETRSVKAAEAVPAGGSCEPRLARGSSRKINTYHVV